MNNQLKITGIVIVKNEETMIENCLKTILWCDELIVVDHCSSDQSVTIAKKYTSKVFKFDQQGFGALRNFAISKATHNWIVFADADERFSPQLADEIKKNLKDDVGLLRVKRENIFFGKHMTAGGWENDFVERVINKTHFVKYQGEIHESPKSRAKTIDLSEPLIHFSHRDLISGLKKTIEWTPIEAKLIHQNSGNQVGLGLVIKKALSEFFKRYFLKKGFRDGEIGLSEAIIQSINRFFVYFQVYELKNAQKIQSNYSERSSNTQPMAIKN